MQYYCYYMQLASSFYFGIDFVAPDSKIAILEEKKQDWK